MVINWEELNGAFCLQMLGVFSAQLGSGAESQLDCSVVAWGRGYGAVSPKTQDDSQLRAEPDVEASAFCSRSADLRFMTVQAFMVSREQREDWICFLGHSLTRVYQDTFLVPK